MPTQLRSKCPKCGLVVKITETQVGRRVRCPGCKWVFEVSSAQVAASTPSLEQAPEASATLDGKAADTDGKPDGGVGRPAPNGGKLGRFELQELIGQGAFGRVYRAYDPQLDRHVALKVPTFGPEETPKVMRFLAEAKAAAKLRHPNIVPTYDSGQIDGKYFIAAQFVVGQSLAKQIRQNLPDFRQAAEWVRQLADALAHAHKEQIVHRDMKPDNVMVDEHGAPQIMDFGLAKRLNDDSAMTTDGSVLGTPAYMAPEQARGDLANVGPHSDQYGLGVVLYELLTGRKPFEGPPHAVIAQVIAIEPPAPCLVRPNIPRDLEAICQKAMSKDPAQRYADCKHFSVDLHRWLSGFETRAHPVGPVGRAMRWCQRSRIAVAAGSAGILAGLAILVAVAAALWHANSVRQRATFKELAADQQQQRVQQDFAKLERDRKLKEESLTAAEAAAESSKLLAEQRDAEVKAAKEEAAAKSRELADALAKLKAAQKSAPVSSPATNKAAPTAPATAAKEKPPSGRPTAEEEAAIERLVRSIPAKPSGTPLQTILERERNDLEKHNGSVLAIGQVGALGISPNEINSQMEILPGGYFITGMKSLGPPLCFRHPELRPLDVRLQDKPRTGRIVDVGYVQLVPIEAAEAASVKANIRFEDSTPNLAATIELECRSTTNRAFNGTYGSTFGRKILAKSGSDGNATAEGLSAGDYFATIRANGFVTQSGRLSLAMGQTHDLGSFVLERPKRLSLEWVTSDTPTFKKAKPMKTIVPAGTKWSDLEFTQFRGWVFGWSVQRARVLKLGPGQLKDYIDHTGMPGSGLETSYLRPGRFDSGSVYVVEISNRKRWILLAVTYDAPTSDPPPENFNRPLSISELANSISAK